MGVGVLAYRIIKEVLFSPLVVSVMLVAGGIAMLLIERFRPSTAVLGQGEVHAKVRLKAMGTV